MLSTEILPESAEGISHSPIMILFNDKFKTFVNNLMTSTEIAKKFKPRLYSYADFIISKFYCIISNKSLHDTCEYLNQLRWDYAIKHRIRKPNSYSDGLRNRRLNPHQTEVDKSFRRLSEKDVKIIFGGILNYINAAILDQYIQERKWAVIADNVKDPYYGAVDPRYHIKTPYLPGTNVAWHTQGISILSKDIHLYVDFHTIKKGVYRCLNLPDSVDWLIWRNVDITRLLVDREFYRAALVQDMYDRGLPVLMPTKKFKWVRHRMEQYLLGKGKLVSGTPFMQSYSQYPYQKGAYVRLVLMSHNGRGAWEVREDYRNGKCNFDEALSQLAGFYTTEKPWKNEKDWSRWLMKEYKRRWWIETGFSNLNIWHIRFRTRNLEVILTEKYMNACFYNLWQLEKKINTMNNVLPRDRTQEKFREKMKLQIKRIILNSTC